MSKMNKDELERIFYAQLETIESRGCPPRIIKHFLKMKEGVIEQASNLIPSEIDVPFCPVIPCFYGDCIVPGCISVDFLATMIRKRKIVGNKLFDVAGVNYFHSSEKITDNIQTPNRPYYIIGIRYNNRINTEKKNGGILGVFRQGAMEKSRTVTVNGLIPDRKYSVLLAPEGKQIAVLTGIQLTKEGFSVDFKNEYEGNVYEIREIE